MSTFVFSTLLVLLTWLIFVFILITKNNNNNNNNTQAQDDNEFEEAEEEEQEEGQEEEEEEEEEQQEEEGQGQEEEEEEGRRDKEQNEERYNEEQASVLPVQLTSLMSIEQNNEQERQLKYNQPLVNFVDPRMFRNGDMADFNFMKPVSLSHESMNSFVQFLTPVDQSKINLKYRINSNGPLI